MTPRAEGSSLLLELLRAARGDAGRRAVISDPAGHVALAQALFEADSHAAALKAVELLLFVWRHELHANFVLIDFFNVLRGLCALGAAWEKRWGAAMTAAQRHELLTGMHALWRLLDRDMRAELRADAHRTAGSPALQDVCALVETRVTAGSYWGDDAELWAELEQHEGVSLYGYKVVEQLQSLARGLADARAAEAAHLEAAAAAATPAGQR